MKRMKKKYKMKYQILRKNLQQKKKMIHHTVLNIMKITEKTVIKKLNWDSINKKNQIKENFIKRNLLKKKKNIKINQ